MAHKFILIALVAVLAGCASPDPQIVIVSTESPHPDAGIVAHTLQSYVVGKTTFADFKKDSGLIVAKHQTRSMPGPWAPGAIWKIYETSETGTVRGGKFLITRKFVVGDFNRPIST